MLFRKLFILFLLLSTIISKSQYIVSEKYTHANSLDSNEILEMFMDSRQFLWVTTKYGIYIKDMGRFKLSSRFKEIKFNNVYDIFEDKNNDLWFASYGRGVAYFDGSKIIQYTEKEGLVSDLVSNITSHKDNIYIGGNNGISVINPSNKSIQKIYPTSSDKKQFEVVAFIKIDNKLFACTKFHGVFEIKDNRLVLAYYPGEIQSSYTYGNNIIFSNKNGIKILSNQDFFNRKYQDYTTHFPIIWDYDLISKDKYWMVTHDETSSSGSILEFDGTNLKNINKSLELGSIVPNRIVYDKYNDIAYVSTIDQGLMRFVLNTPYKYYPTDNAIIECIEEAFGKDYILSSNGLYVNKSEKTELLTSKAQFWNFYEKNKENKQNLIINDLNFFEINSQIKEEYLKFYKLEVHENHLWINSNIGLFKLNNKGQIINYYPIHTQYFTFINNQLIEANPNGGVKIFTDLDQLIYKNYSDTITTTPTFVVSITKNSKAVFFGSAINGLFKYENGKFISYLFNGQFLEKKIKTIKAIGEDKIAVATEFGDIFLFKIIQNRLQLIRKISGKSIDSVNINFIEEMDGKLLIGSFSNIVIVDGYKYYYIDKAQSVNYKSLSASAVNKGNLVVGTDKGYYLIDVNGVVNIKSTAPKVLITKLQINDTKLSRDHYKWYDLIDKNLRLEHHQNNIYIDFTIINPKYSTKYKYRFRLNKGEEWSEYFSDEVLHFNSLKSGTYNIELEITNLNGGDVSVISLIKIKIDPPFYQNPYFIGSLILVLLLLFFKYYKNKIRRLNEINQLKIKNIQEVKDEENKRITLEKKMSEVRLMALQGQMNPHFIFNILNSIQYYIIDNDVNNALETLNQFARLIRKMLELSSKNEIALKEEIEFLTLYVKIENFRYKHKVEFSINIDPAIDIQKTNIPPMLLQPLVENCFVHAFNPTVSTNKINIHVKKSDELLIIIIADNGKGIEQSSKKEKFYESKGLGIIRERLQLFNNSEEEFLKFESNSEGTKAILALKLSF